MRRSISYRISLVVALPVLIIVVGASIAINAYLTTKSSIEALTGQLFDQVGAQATEQTRAHMTQAIPAADLVVALLRDRALPADITKDDALVLELADVLRANPGFAWVSFSDTAGSFVGVQRTTGGLVTNRSHIEGGQTELFEHRLALDDTLTLVNHKTDLRYDPRGRPFYELATKAKHRVWTPPYMFIDLGADSSKVEAGARQGITCAAPVYTRSGDLRGVVTVDFDLGALSRFVSELRLSAHSVVFLYANDGTIIAHPTLLGRARAADAKPDELVTKANVDDSLVRAFFDAHPTAEERQFEVRHAGVRYLAIDRPIDIDEHSLPWHVGAIAPVDDFEGPLAKNARFAIVVSGIVIAIAVLVGFMFARQLAGPLVKITGEMERAGRFEIGEHVPSPSWFTEILLMDRALGAMKSGLRSFGAYVPRDLVRAVLESGERAELGGKTKRLTVFFSDLAGFTTLSETMTPDALVELLGGYFDAMTKVIQSRGGTIDKFIGDAIMAFWNAPKDEPDHATLACEAALECQRKLAEMCKRDPRLAGLRARIGLATGDVLVGNIGSPDRMNYTVMGDTANLASRLEGLNKAYGTPVMISEATYEAVKGVILARPVDVVAVKGKVTGIRVFEPIALEKDACDDDRRFCELATRALGAYLARDFAGAANTWAEALLIREGDVACALMKTRALELAKDPPPPAWDGAHVMHEK